jgi:hypothetical protein
LELYTDAPNEIANEIILKKVIGENAVGYTRRLHPWGKMVEQATRILRVLVYHPKSLCPFLGSRYNNTTSIIPANTVVAGRRLTQN